MTLRFTALAIGLAVAPSLLRRRRRNQTSGSPVEGELIS